MNYFNDKNMAVITSRYVLFDKAPILFVIHNKDGIWEFYGKEELEQDDDYKVISIEELINLDLTILELSLMPPCCFATRNIKNEAWKIKHQEQKFNSHILNIETTVTENVVDEVMTSDKESEMENNEEDKYAERAN